MNRFLDLMCCGILGVLSHGVFGQLTTANLYATEDSYTTTALPNNNFGNNQTMKSGTDYTPGPRGSYFQYHQRAYVKFDLSSIPSNAIIYSAELRLVLSGSSSGTFNWKTKLITSDWSEGLVTANNQPNISNLVTDVITTTPVSSGTQDIDVKSMLQRMVYGASDNYGWCIQVSNEGATSNTGAWFHTSENSNQFLRPLLYIEYYLPPILSDVVVNHESGVGVSDGSIDYNHTSLGSLNHSYQWYNGAGQLMLGEVNKQLTDVPYGWYGVEITGTSTGEKAYFGFLVGTECEEVTITYTTSPNFTSNAMTYSRVSGTIDYGDVNYGNYSTFRTQNWNYSPWSNMKSYLDFHTWMDDAFTVNQADLLIRGSSHWNSGTTNPSEIDDVTTFWNENFITYNNPPSDDNSPTISLPNTTSSTQNATLDMISFWNQWKQNNNNNYGVLLQLQEFDDNYNTRQMYHSPNAGTESNRPSWTFSLALNHDDDVFYCNPEANPYAEVKKELDAGYVIAYEGNLKFTFQEDYEIDPSEFWTVNIYDNHHFVIAGCDAAGNTTGGMVANSYTHDDNRFTIDLSTITGASANNYYLLEVITEKDKKHYLKFFYHD